MKNSTIRLIAIDPGASGGLAWFDADGNAQAKAMPSTEGDLLDLLQNLKMYGVSVAVLEEVGGFVGKAQPGSAMFKFGRSFGFILGALAGLCIRVELVKPQKWQKHFSLGTAKATGSKSAWKNKLKGEAQRRFPHIAVTLKTADALLILDYAKEASHGN